MTKILNNKEIIQKDIENIYLGNLRTVEFDLNLPSKGKFGSKIKWESKDERFITNDGKVTRPKYGKGNRIIELTALFSLGDEIIKKVYEVKILEEENDIVISYIYPINITEEVNKEFYLPQVIAVKTENNQVLAHSVTWDEGEKKVYHNKGKYRIFGKVKDTEYSFEAEINIVDKLDNKVERMKQIESYPINKVRLVGDSMAKTAQDRRLAFLLKVNDDEMLYNFRVAAGLDTKNASEMIGWDSPESLLKGHTTGHYLSALALCYGCTGNKEILLKLNYMIEELNKVQLAFEADSRYNYGFISGYSEEQFDLLEKYVPYPQIWAPYYTLHKIFAGLLDSYEIAGNKIALIIADKLGDWTYNRLSKLPHEQLKKMWGMYIAGEFGGMNESLVTLYTYTKKPEHLKAAKLFDNDRLFFPMEQKVDALGYLHANQHIPQIIGAIKIYESTNEDKYYNIANFFWNSVAKAHTYSIGGTGEGEMFQQPYSIGAKLTEHTAETCASYNMLKLTKNLYEYEPTIDKMDYYERTMINHILSTTDHEEIGGSTYFMPTCPGAQKGFDIENSCCHGTGLENHFKYGESIFYHSNDKVFINLFLPATLKDEVEQTELKIEYNENIPERVIIKIKKFSKILAIRKPYWSEEFMESFINGQRTQGEVKNGYLELLVKDGDTIAINFKTSIRLEATPDFPEIGSLAYGPYVLAAIDNKKEYLQLSSINDVIKDDNSLIFRSKENIYKPLAQVNREHYHLYVKQSN